MTHRTSVLILAILAAFAGVAGAAEIQGKVSGIMGTDVRLTLEGSLLPQPGDEVTIRFQIPGGGMVVVGTWKVTSIDGETVLASLVAATGAPAVDQLATIVSTNPIPRRPSPVPVDDDIRIGFGGQIYRTRYQHQVPDGQPIDIYFFQADAPPDSAGNPRYNRFVREPAENRPGAPVWWHCRWLLRDGEWKYEQTKVEGVAVLRLPFDPASHEGSVWSSTTSDSAGNRKEQDFKVEYRMTTANGVTRMTTSSAVAVGRISGDRFVFSVFKPDGTGPVGEGFCVFSGSVFSGGWSATNGKAGIWEGRKKQGG